ncbi:MAG TPA: penicillin-binding transpeptidase domain-containing protein [Kineosporiaceae bacterium]|nr:penicillin-binding transpeptidase domain-containing protein [Kineosporiaceae bacterium]
MSRRSWIIVTVIIALIVAAVPTGFIVLKQRRESAERAAQQAAADSFAQAWKANTLASVSFAGASGPEAAKAVAAATARLTTAAKDAPSAITVGKITGKGANSRTVSLEISWKVPGDRVWKYPSTLTVVKQGDQWLPKYEPTMIHPKLMDKGLLVARTQVAKRGEIIGAKDDVLVTERPVVLVGLEPGRADDIDASAQQIASIVGVDGAALAKRAKAASATAFVEAISLRKAAYQEVRDELRPIPGAVFQDREVSLAPTAEFSRALIGTVGQATKEIVDKSKGRVQAGDLTGLSGLQQAYDEQLSGQPGLTVSLVPPTTKSTVATDVTEETLFTDAAVAGKPVHITLDRSIQTAADAALRSAKKPAALVAIRASTGEVLAVANGGPNAAGYNRAFLGQYPPGSTFKVASSLALLGAGVTRQTTVKCPATLNVGGKVFSNAEDEVLGAVPFHTDFADSCNTAFVGSSTKISAADLAKAAKSLGYGQPNKLGVNAFTGKVPTTGDAVSHAAAMIGQDKVLASPVTVAGASAAVASGTWHAPQLVVEPDQPAGKGTALPAGSDRELQKLMREVVTSGTGVGLRSVPGKPVAGKTGTAEYGSENPPRTHAWFTGFQGDLAFAVVVEDGGFGAESAVPLVKNFLNRLAR